MDREIRFFAGKKGFVRITFLNDELPCIPELMIVPGSKGFSGSENEIAHYEYRIDCGGNT